jgi:multisubunit Na+/H+ antiporter MnhB subunit
MNAVLLRRIAAILVPVSMLFGLALLMKGHDQPGGGFVAGLSFAIAGVLAIAAFGPTSFRRTLKPSAETCVLLGGVLITLTVIVPAFFELPLLQHGSFKFEVPVLGKNKLHSALLFDIGVLLVVGGGVAFIASLLATDSSSEDSSNEESSGQQASREGGAR